MNLAASAIVFVDVVFVLQFFVWSLG